MDAVVIRGGAGRRGPRRKVTPGEIMKDVAVALGVTGSLTAIALAAIRQGAIDSATLVAIVAAIGVIGGHYFGKKHKERKP